SLVAGGDHGLPVALVAADRARGYRDGASSTRIAVLPATLTGPLRLLTLAGSYGVDAVGPDGHYLYLIEHLAGEHYQVRAYDLRTARLDPQVVVDKREPNERMQGLPLARAASSTGNWVFTLYRRPSGVPFVHALMASSLFAFCIDLPARARVGAADASSWGIASRGSKLFVANAATGFVAVVDLASFAVQQTASLGVQALTTPVTRPLAASSDGTRLYLARPQGLVALDGSTLAPAAPLTSDAFGSLALGARGAVLYATGGGATRTLDLRTGSLEGTPWATGKGTLVGVVNGL
ncbi:MAG: hypothetical protein ABI317_09155, partial [Gaiellales bacterium]